MADSIIPNIPVYPPQGIQAELNLIYLYNPDIALGYVTHDGSLSGTGLPTDPLKIVNAIPSGATAGQVLGFGTNGIEWTTLDYYTTSQIDTIVSNLQTTISQTYLSKTDAASTYATQDALEAVEAKLSAVYRFRGSVATYNDLPTTDNTVGDVWNVEDTGANYAWTGDAWDKLSETIDLTPYLTKEDAASTYATITTVNGKQDALTAEQLAAANSGITSAKVASYDAYAGEISAKVNIAQGEENAGKVMTVGADGNLAPANVPVVGLPDQTGNAGKFLGTNGTDPIWTNVINDSFVIHPSYKEDENYDWIIYNKQGTAGTLLFDFGTASIGNCYALSIYSFDSRRSGITLGSSNYKWSKTFTKVINNGADIAVPETGGTIALLSDIEAAIGTIETALAEV